MALEKYRQSAGVLAHFKHYLTLLDPLPGQQVLDLGCGSGTFCRVLGPIVAPDGRVTGVDNALEALRVASQLTTNTEYDCIRFEHGDGHHLMFADEMFDSAVCISVLAFCDDPQRVLSELRRVLRPGGRLLVVNSDDDTRIYNGLDQELGRRIQRAIAA